MKTPTSVTIPSILPALSFHRSMFHSILFIPPNLFIFLIYFFFPLLIFLNIFFISTLFLPSFFVPLYICSIFPSPPPPLVHSNPDPTRSDLWSLPHRCHPSLTPTYFINCHHARYSSFGLAFLYCLLSK